MGTKDATEIIFLSWLVNCVAPAKLGDVYRAYLLKINSTASLSRTFGTVFIERVLDLFAIAILGLAAGYWSFRSGLPPAIQVVFGIGVAVVAALALGLFTMRNFGRRIIVALPLPHQLRDLYDRFEEGVFGALVPRQLPILGLLTGLIWLTEGLRLYLVVQALGFPDVYLGLSGAIFVALIGSLLTAVPLSPAGLGIVEAGRGRCPDHRVWRPAARSDRHRAARSGHQCLLDHRVRVDRLRAIVETAWHGPDLRARGRSGTRHDGLIRASHACAGRGRDQRPKRPCGADSSVMHPQRPLQCLFCIRAVDSGRTLVMADLAPGHCDRLS